MTALHHRNIRAADADAIVIGAGLNGLICAALLAQARLKVLVLEAQERPGGFCRTAEIIPNYRAPVFAHWIGPLDAAMIKALKLQKLGLDANSQRLSAIALSPDGHHIVLDPHARRGTGALGQHSQADAKAYPPFEAAMRKLAAGLGAHMHDPPLRAGPKSTNPPRVKHDESARAVLEGVALRSIASLLEEYFESPVLQGALALDAVIGTGLGPRSPGTTLSWLEKLALETVRADTTVWVQGGPGALVHAVMQAAQSAGATIRMKARVEALIAHNGGAEGVALAGGETIYAPIVVSSLAPSQVLNWPTARRAAPPGASRWTPQTALPHGLAKVHLALRGAPAFKGLEAKDLRARLLIAGSLDAVSGAFEAANRGDWSDPPPMEVVLPSAMDASLGPKDGHILSALIPFAPLDPKERWADLENKVTLSTIAALSRYAPDLPNRVLAAEVETPEAMSQISAFPLWRRVEAGPTHTVNPYASTIDGLFFCGAGTHPRLGASGLNGRNCAEAILAAAPQGSETAL